MQANECITIRASSLPDLLDCPARWEAKNLLGKRLPSSDHARIGTAVHASTALYDASVLAHQGLTVDETEAAAVDAIYDDKGEVIWDDFTPAAAEKTVRALHRRYCSEIAPQQEYVAVEVRCDRLEIRDLGIALEGTTDRVRKTEDGFGIADLKSGKAAVKADGSVETARHATQLGAYELMAQFASGVPITVPAQVIGLQTGKTEKAQRVAVAEAPSAREILLGEPDQPGILEYAAKIVTGGLFFGNPRSMLCHAKYCPIFKTCHFRT